MAVCISFLAVDQLLNAYGLLIAAYQRHILLMTGTATESLISDVYDVSTITALNPRKMATLLMHFAIGKSADIHSAAVGSPDNSNEGGNGCRLSPEDCFHLVRTLVCMSATMEGPDVLMVRALVSE